MKISIHQPEHLPWLGFFEKMKLADLFVILDHVQFTKNNFQNRNRIRNKFGDIHWLTVPTEEKSTGQKSINRIKIPKDSKWQKTYLEKIRHFYVNSMYFNEVFPSLNRVVDLADDNLFQLNMKMINLCRNILSIETPIIFSSSLLLTEKKSHMIVEICNKFNADTYISGIGGKNYLDEVPFKASKINIIYQNAEHLKPYSTFNKTIMSTLDSLMYHGPNIGNSLGIKSSQSELA